MVSVIRALLLAVAFVNVTASNAASQTIWFVNASLQTGSDAGTSWDDAFQGQAGLQSALAIAGDDDEIWVAAGTYTPSQSSDRADSFSPFNGVSIFGGFAGFESALNQRDPNVHSSILSGDLAGDDLPAFVNRSDNAYHVISVSSGSIVLDGLTIRGGTAQDEPGGLLAGGGILIEFGASVSVRECQITDNQARNGGGVEIRGACHLERCTVFNNRATGVGFASGGGVNSLVGFDTANATMTNCLFFGNSALHSGGAIGADHSGLRLVNCTVVGNRVIEEPFAGGVGLQGTFGTLEIANSIIWGNATSAGSGDELNQLWNPNLPSFLILNHTTIQGFTGAREYVGSGNLNEDPQFMDLLGQDGIPGSGDEDYRLNSVSNVIDAGGNALVPEGVQTDLAGRPRFVDVPSVADTGAGTAPLVDLGALEVQVDSVPAVSTWFLMVLAMLMVTAATLILAKTGGRAVRSMKT